VSSITLLTGEIQTGKSRLCLEVVAAARAAGVELGGLVSPGVFQAGEKTAIDVLDVKSGEKTRLAEAAGGSAAGVSTKRWTFHSQAVAWGNQVLETAVPCELLVIDELGPLEFTRGEGWMTGFDTVASGEYQAALLVIRPSLLEKALNCWQVSRIINLDDPDDSLLSGKDLLAALLELPG
jgi:nucleoside-triphosphatase THEP1